MCIVLTGLYNHYISKPVLERRTFGLLLKCRRQHDANWRLCREDLGPWHILCQRQAFFLARRHRNEQNGSTAWRRVHCIRNEVKSFTCRKQLNPDPQATCLQLLVYVPFSVSTSPCVQSGCTRSSLWQFHSVTAGCCLLHVREKICREFERLPGRAALLWC